MATVVFAPNAFKGSIGAADAAAALAAGWSAVRPRDTLLAAPMADGGDGTLDALAATIGAVRRSVRVTGPLGGTVDAAWLLLADGVAVVELAGVGGLTVAATDPLPARERAARAGTAGFGEVVVAALEAGCRQVLLTVGGSASTDGGAGLLTALGARLLDASGRPVPPGNAGLGALATVDLDGLAPLPPDGVLLLSDVTNPLLGPLGAAAVFAPQKGATAHDVTVFERNLAAFAAMIGRRRAVDPASPGMGAAGGVGFGAAVWGARIVDGAAEIAERIGLPELIRGADAVVTGEGRYDSQTARGKAPERVRAIAGDSGVPALLAAGSIEAPTEEWAGAASLSVLAGGAAAALAAPSSWLEAAGARLAEGFGR
ncbi:MAG: glycerate 2-kinase [Microbacteriaceae bacterium]|nr:glycerate 2-kinase [Microbacteriaceae bacterium]